MRPGITVRPCRSITRVCGPASLRMSELPPTAAILPSRMAMAFRMENCLSTVKILPFTRMVSAFWVQAGEAIAKAKIASNAARMKFVFGIFISRVFHTSLSYTSLIEAPRRSVFLVPVYVLARYIHRHRPHLGKVVKRFDACLAAGSAILEAPPRRGRIKPVMIVYPNHAEEQLACHAMRARNVAGPERSGKAESSVIGNANGICLVLKWHDHGHRPEHFLLRDFGSRIGVVQYGGLHKKTRGQACGGGRCLS